MQKESYIRSSCEHYEKQPYHVFARPGNELALYHAMIIVDVKQRITVINLFFLNLFKPSHILQTRLLISHICLCNQVRTIENPSLERKLHLGETINYYNHSSSISTQSLTITSCITVVYFNFSTVLCETFPPGTRWGPPSSTVTLLTLISSISGVSSLPSI